MRSAAELLSAVRADALLAPGRAVVVMLSGGRDSTCLLDLAVTVCGAQSVQALHVNYGLRESAGRDEARCRELCEGLGVALTVNTAPPAPPEGNVQAWARTLRYEVAGAISQRYRSDIAAGHTATDQVETILYRLASSPSRRALLGMKARDGMLIRPLLAFTREETGAYCRERGLAWVDDETNETGKYARGRVRHELLPALRSIHPAAEQNILTLAEILRDEQSALDALVNAALAEGGGAITLAALRELPVGVARILVQELADAVHGRPAPGTARRLPDILELREQGTAHLDLPHGVRATVVDGLLRFAPTDAKHP